MNKIKVILSEKSFSVENYVHDQQTIQQNENHHAYKLNQFSVCWYILPVLLKPEDKRHQYTLL